MGAARTSEVRLMGQPGKLMFLRPEMLPGIELMVAYDDRNLWHVYHETYGFCACRTAGAYYRYRGGTHQLLGGDTMLLEAGEVHRNMVVRRDANFKVLFLQPNLFADIAHELGIPGPPHFDQALTSNPRVYGALYQLSAAIESGDMLLKQQTLFNDFTLGLLEMSEKKPRLGRLRREPEAITRAKSYLRERFDREVSLDELAAVAGLSRFHFAHAFRREVGLPPHAYQIHVRVARARTLLGLGMPQANIAAQLGFADQSHFIRHFKKVLGVTPGDYARGTV